MTLSEFAKGELKFEMTVTHNLITPPRNTAVALGFFDGAHIGHRAVVLSATQTSGLLPCVFTFKESSKNMKALCTSEQKYAMFQEFGASMIYSIPFYTIKDLTPEEFVKEVLKNTLRAKKVFCGFNYHFGKGGIADVNDLKRLCKKHKIAVKIIPPVLYKGETVSSTLIKKALAQGQIELAGSLLGRPYGYTLQMEQKQQYLLTQIIPPHLALPKEGLYFSEVIFKNKKMPGMTKISKPGLCQTKLGIEMNLHEKFVTVNLLAALRTYLQ